MLELPKFVLKDMREKTRTDAPKIGVLTSGGDAPGMNAAIRAVVRYGISRGCEVFGIRKGYSGLVEGQIEELHLRSVANIIQRGGTILKTDRCPAFLKKSVRAAAARTLRARGIEHLVVIGGDGSFAGAAALGKETGLRVVGVPGTIDNDIAGTDETIGFDTAVNTALDAIDRIRDTASSHERTFLVEVMGRNSGFIAAATGMGGGAETVWVPEMRPTLAQMAEVIERGVLRGKNSSIIVVAEGNEMGLSHQIAESLSKKGISAKVCTLGHTQRGGSPSPRDRLLASILGASAVAALLQGRTQGMMGVRHGKAVFVEFSSVIGRKKSLPPEILKLGEFLAN
jgi:6-phosphofructokinase 1